MGQHLKIHDDVEGKAIEIVAHGGLLGFVTAAVALPTNGTPGWLKGARIFNTVNGGFYVNVGTELSCTFVAQDESTLGFLPLTLEAFRTIASNDIPATAATPPGGLMTNNTTPAYLRTNTSTDKSIRISWVASNSTEIQASGLYTPPDMDVTQPCTLNCMVSGSTTNNTNFTANVFPGVGGSDAGGTTTSYVSGGAVVQLLTLAIAANKIGAYPNFFSLALTPSAHTTDAFNLYAAWFTYTKKLLTA